MVNIIGRPVSVQTLPAPDNSGGDALGAFFTRLAGNFLDGTSGEIKQEQLRKLRDENTDRDSQRMNRDLFASSFASARDGNLDINSTFANGIEAGISADNIAGYILGLTANIKGAVASETSNALVGTGRPYSSTAEAFQSSQATELAEAKMATDRAAATQEAIDGRTLVPVIENGQMVYRRKVDAVGATPVVSKADVEGTILRNLPQADQRSVALGTSNQKPVEYVGPNGPTLGRIEDSLGQAPVLSTDQLRAQELTKALPTAPQESRDRFLYGSQGEGTLYNYRTPDGRSGTTRDGRVDVNGAPLPQGTQVFKVQAAELSNDTAVRNHMEQRVATETAAAAIDRLDGLLGQDNSGAAVGFLGQGARMLNDVRAQFEAATKLAGGTGLAEEAQSGGLNAAIDNAIRSRPQLMQAAQQLGIDATVIRSQITDLAYMLAKAQDPGGRVSNQDAERAADTIGASLQDPKAARVVLQDLKTRLNANFAIRDRIFNETYSRQPGAPAAAQPSPAASPPAAPVKWGRDANGNPVRIQ